MIAGLSPSSCCGVTPFNVSTPISNPLLAKARKKNTTAYTRNIRAPNTMRPAPLRKYCSLDIVSSLVSTTLRWTTTDEYKGYHSSRLVGSQNALRGATGEQFRIVSYATPRAPTDVAG